MLSILATLYGILSPLHLILCGPVQMNGSGILQDRLKTAQVSRQYAAAPLTIKIGQGKMNGITGRRAIRIAGIIVRVNRRIRNGRIGKTYAVSPQKRSGPGNTIGINVIVQEGKGWFCYRTNG